MSATEAAPRRRTHCPTCGVKLPEQPLSLCAYCASPLDLMEKGEGEAEGGKSANAGKIERILASDKLQAALDWSPPESLAWQRALGLLHRGKMLTGVAAVVFVLGLVLESGSILTRYFTIGAAVLAVWGLWTWMRGISIQKRETALPILKRPGVVLERRSETEIEGWGGSTVYFFKIEFEDGVVAEFAYPGTGSGEEPYTNGMTGVAFTRGTALLSFKHVRV